MEKAVREAKVHTAWTAPDEAYEGALREFIQATMNDGTFRADLEDFVGELVAPGRINSLAQTLLKLTAPGVPDIYQGTELWDLSLVDPDNRRPVDFELRRRLLDESARLSPEAILARMDEGLPKLWLIHRALHLRREHPGCFGPDGHYRPLAARGARSGHVVAFARGDAVIAVAPRLVWRLDGRWADTELTLPDGRWRNVLTDEPVAGGAVRIRDLLARFPVALLKQQAL